jgi:adenylate cyclase, class 2
MHLNFEFKARAHNLAALEAQLQQQQPRFVGDDHQTDTYFQVAYGRLKLREGNIENALIHYQRPDTAGAKTSDVILYQHQPDATLKQALTAALGVKVVVEKRRKIYFIDNIKFHFDRVEGLGEFVEVEAIDQDGTIGLEKLSAQCAVYIQLFGIRPEDFISVSYSDMLLAKKSSTA